MPMTRVERMSPTDSGFMGEGIGADDGLVGLDDEAGHGRDQPRRLHDVFGLHADFKRHEVVAGLDRHHDFFHRGVAGAFAEPVDRTFDLAGAGAQGGQ